MRARKARLKAIVADGLEGRGVEFRPIHDPAGRHVDRARVLPSGSGPGQAGRGRAGGRERSGLPPLAGPGAPAPRPHRPARLPRLGPDHEPAGLDGRRQPLAPPSAGGRLLGRHVPGDDGSPAAGDPRRREPRPEPMRRSSRSARRSSTSSAGASDRGRDRQPVAQRTSRSTPSWWDPGRPADGRRRSSPNRDSTVLLLEAGRAVTPEDYPLPAPAENRLVTSVTRGLAGQMIQMRCHAFNERTWRFFVNDRQNPYTTPRGKPFNWFRGRQVGGRLHIVGARRAPDVGSRAQVREPRRLRGRLAHLLRRPGSLLRRGRDLPRRARIPGRACAALPDGTYLGPIELTPEEASFKAAVEAAFPDRRVIGARIVKHDPDRVPRRRSGPRRPPAAWCCEATRSYIVSPSTPCQGGRPVSASWIGSRRRQEEARADVVVLCAGTIDTLRILFNSASRRHPGGLGNSSGRLGHHLMDHVMVRLAGPLPDHALDRHEDDAADPYDFGRTTGFHVPRFRNTELADPRFLRGYGIAGRDRQRRAPLVPLRARRDAAPVREPRHGGSEEEGRLGDPGRPDRLHVLGQRDGDGRGRARDDARRWPLPPVCKSGCRRRGRSRTRSRSGSGSGGCCRSPARSCPEARFTSAAGRALATIRARPSSTRSASAGTPRTSSSPTARASPRAATPEHHALDHGPDRASVRPPRPGVPGGPDLGRGRIGSPATGRANRDPTVAETGLMSLTPRDPR